MKLEPGVEGRRVTFDEKVESGPPKRGELWIEDSDLPGARGGGKVAVAAHRGG